ncbi:TetR/AcrR family transcriptional regulator [Cryobacterium tagatosivorans]|uniref:TetR/AcrR family transcriptional regulator n=1 Tax=Cryobacterium tagatosivorans TaxID=1259199 RepID=A0A4R8UF52_9MICO|nr:TetR/AcrR family transcriptional regulator [Cryobacterium tagatosivorans]
MAEIAENVGLTQAGLLYHFPSKASLLLAVLEERERRNDEAENRWIEAGNDYISAFLHTLQTNERSPSLVQLFAVLSAEGIAATHPSHDWWVSRYERLVGNATAGLSGVVDPSRLPAGVTTETVARWLIAMSDGLRIQWLLSPGSLNRHHTVAQFAALLEPYLKPSVDGSSTTDPET